MLNNNQKYEDAAYLTAFLDTLDRKSRADFIKLTAFECNVSRNTVYSWRYMCCRIPDKAKAIIERLAGEAVFPTLNKSTDET